MKNFKGFAFGLVLGLGLALSSLGFAQNATPSAQKNETESCCAMASCCCKGESCDKMKHDAKDHAAKGGCCCCGGDSCDLKMKHEMEEKPKG